MTEPAEATARMLAWARNSAAYRLSRRMMTERELSDAIKRKARQKFEGITEEQLAAVSAAAIEYGHLVHALDDKSYAEVAVRSAVRSGRSRRAISRRLAQKGIERQIVEDAVQVADDLVAALAFARKRAFGPFRRVPLDDKRAARELAAFARNGFGFEIGKAILSMDLEEGETILAGQPFA
ncbi:recombination regulator RecX [Pseudorhizobium endolithicum]|uniref:Regulatory protein RecX n=1 Tax=Pseudorhizobium endolithicum TaxID=1191678 RepID=A0ABM8PH04_9HYPH|nr:regulatory protein RecX [Pseudorhizobium endolithicum]CAD7029295.1 recombination regulator RecX [Pseudorhizobium endolithicum]